MSSKAYIGFSTEPDIDNNKNEFSINGGLKHPIMGCLVCYSITPGNHNIEVTSGTGEKWVFEANVEAGQLLNVKAILSDRDICNIEYNVEPAPTAIVWGALSLD